MTKRSTQALKGRKRQGSKSGGCDSARSAGRSPRTRRRLTTPRPGDRQPPAGHQFGRIAHWLILGVDVVHEHRHGLVARQLHVHFGRHAPIGNVGRRAVADAVRADVRHASGLVRPQPPQCSPGVHIPDRIVGRRRDVGNATPALFQINQTPFEWADFGAADSKLELQANSQRDGGIFQFLSL